jgi:hypothetical protein
MDLDADRVAAARGVGEEDGSATGWDNFLENQLGFYTGTERLPRNQLLEKKFSGSGRGLMALYTT